MPDVTRPGLWAWRRRVFARVPWNRIPAGHFDSSNRFCWRYSRDPFPISIAARNPIAVFDIGHSRILRLPESLLIH